MARSRLLPLFLVLALVSSACAFGGVIPRAATIQAAIHPTSTNPAKSPSDTPEPSQTALPASTSTAAQATSEQQTETPEATETAEVNDTPEATDTPEANELPTATLSSMDEITKQLDCANYKSQNVKITVPDGVGYRIFCVGMSGSAGVQIIALDSNNKQDPKATFTKPIKICVKGSGDLMYMDLFNGQITPTILKATQEGDFSCVELTKPGSVFR